MLASRAAALLMAVLVVIGRAAEEDEVESDRVIMTGTLPNSTELHIIKGGQSVVLTLHMQWHDGWMRFKPDFLHSDDLFSEFLTGFTTGSSTFVKELPNLITRKDVELLDDRKSLKITLRPCSHFQIAKTETVFLYIPSLILDCVCAYRIPVDIPIVIHPMVAPTPLVKAPETICEDRITVTSSFVEEPMDIVREALGVRWEAVLIRGDGFIELTNPTNLTSDLIWRGEEGEAELRITYSLRDDTTTFQTVITKVPAPPPAQLATRVMHVVGTTAVLNALPLPTGVEGKGLWSKKVGLGSTVIDNPNEPNAIVRDLGEYTLLEWRVSGHVQCPQTSAELRLYTEQAEVLSESHEVCDSTTRVQAVAPKLSGLRGEWRASEGGVNFVPAGSPNATVVGLPHGTSTLQWVLTGDGDSQSTSEVVVTRRVKPRATIITNKAEAYLGGKEIPLEAEPVVEGTGTWSLVETTCDSVPSISSDSPSTTLKELGHISMPCTVTVMWKVVNPPCDESTATLTIAVVAQPPSDPDVGPPIRLCGMSTAKLSAEEPLVGLGRWSVVTPETLEIKNPNSPKALLQGIREGRNVVRWTVVNGNLSKHADLEVYKHALPSAKVTVPSSPVVTICGAVLSMQADTSKFGPSDYGEWRVSDSNITCEGYGCRSSPKATFKGFPPGESIVQWVTNQRTAKADCPDGMSDNRTVQSWQFPKEVPTIYTVHPTATLHLQSALEKAASEAIAKDPSMAQYYYPGYLDGLARLAGKWSVQGSTATLRAEEGSKTVTELADIPMGDTFVTWTIDSTACHPGQRESFRIRVKRGLQRKCTVLSSDSVHIAERNHATVVGPSIQLSLDPSDLSVDTMVHWRVIDGKEGVTFSNPDSTETMVSGLPEGDCVIQADVTTGEAAFAGHCALTVTSIRARVPPAKHSVCSDSAQISAEKPPGDVRVKGYWATPKDSPLTVHHPHETATKVSGLQEGANVFTWVIELKGKTDTAEVIVKRDRLQLPFGASSARLVKRVVNMKELSMPWQGPAAGWRASGAGSPSMRVHNGVITFRGMVLDGPASIFQYGVQPPASSSCSPVTFTLEVYAVTAHVTAAPITSECDLLHGAVLQLQAGTRLEWKRTPDTESVAEIRTALGSTLGSALREAVTNDKADVLSLHFQPIELPRNPKSGLVESLVVKDVLVPPGLFADHVVAPRDTTVLFSIGDKFSTNFTVHPITTTLALNGKPTTTEHDLNTKDAVLSIHLHNTRTDPIAGKIKNGTQFLDTLRQNLITKAHGQRGMHEWESRKGHIVDSGNVSFTESTIAIQLRADPWYTIGANEEVHLLSKVSDLCGSELGSREVRSRDLHIRDTPPQIIVSGEINECDFELRGANITITAVGCSFQEGSEMSLHFFESINKEVPPRGWNEVVRRGQLNSTTFHTETAKQRRVMIHPCGPYVFEIPQHFREEVRLTIPSYMVIHGQPPKASSPQIVAQGRVHINDTFIEVINNETCVDTLREAGHTLTLKLHGDSWTDIRVQQHNIIRSIQGSKDIVGGWEDAFRETRMKRRWKTRLIDQSALEVTFAPMEAYTSSKYEEVIINLPGVATMCSKCLAGISLLKIFHPHSLVALPQRLEPPTDRAVTLRLPCARFSHEITAEQVRLGFSSLTRVQGGFDAMRDQITSGRVTWSDNHTVIIPLSWPPAGNYTLAENISVVFAPNSIVPSTGETVSLVAPILVSERRTDDSQGWLASLFNMWLAFSPFLFFFFLADLMRDERGCSGIERMLGATGIGLRSIVNMFAGVAFVLLVVNFMQSHTGGDTFLAITQRAYTVVGLIGALWFWGMLIFTDLLKGSMAKHVQNFHVYMRVIGFFAVGSFFKGFVEGSS